MELSPGAAVGPYRLIEPAGHGGMAEVWRAYDARLDRDVAMKFISRQFANEPGYLERFRREARAISRLEHPNILTVHDFGEQDGFTYMVTPFIGSGTLAKRLGRPWAVADALRVVEPLASALDYAHSRGVVHRDVKPSNVLFSAQDRLVLGDFGVARMLEGTSELSHVGLLIGTPRYMAPEQVEGHPATPASDLYALGIVAYELLTGRAPFVAETPLAVLRAHVDKPLPPPRSLNPALPEDVERMLFRALAKDPGDRFPDCGAFAARLRIAAGDVPIVGDPTGEMPTLITDVRPPSAGRSPADVRPPSPPAAAIAEPAPLHGGGGPATTAGSPAAERPSPADPAVRAGRPGRPTRRGAVAAVLGGVTLVGLLALGSVALPQALPSATTRPPEAAPPSPTAGGNPAGVQAAAAAPAALPRPLPLRSRRIRRRPPRRRRRPFGPPPRWPPRRRPERSCWPRTSTIPPGWIPGC
jgi:serine/threonine-protein kinase